MSISRRGFLAALVGVPTVVAAFDVAEKTGVMGQLVYRPDMASRTPSVAYLSYYDSKTGKSAPLMWTPKVTSGGDFWTR